MRKRNDDKIQAPWLGTTPYDDEPSQPRCSFCSAHIDYLKEDMCYHCWRVHNPGGVSEQIRSWLRMGNTPDKIIYMLVRYDWFSNMTNSTIGRFTRLIESWK